MFLASQKMFDLEKRTVLFAALLTVQSTFFMYECPHFLFPYFLLTTMHRESNAMLSIPAPIPCWSCPPSPPQGQLCPTSRCRCTWYVALSHPSMDAVLIRVQSTSQQSLSTSQLKSSSWQAMLPVITRNVCDPSLNLKLTSARIIPRHLQLAIRNDEELNKYVSRYVISC